MSSTEVMILLVIALITIVIYIIRVNRSATKLNRFLTQFPGPPSIYGIFGNVGLIKSSADILGKLTKFQRKYGSVFHIYGALIVPIKVTIVVTDLKFVEFILASSKTIDKSYTYKFLHKWLSTGLLTSAGEKWKQRRKIITPTFHFKILEQFVDVFNKEGDVLVGKLQTEVGKRSFDVYPFITLFTLDVICETAMGTSVKAQLQKDSQYVRSVKDMCRIVIERSFKFSKFFDLTFPFTEDYRKEKENLETLHYYTDSVITARREKLCKSVNKSTDYTHTESDGRKNRPAFLDLLLQSTINGKPLNNEDIREEVDTFMFEGHDTTASAISFTLYCLANNPQVQEKAIKEIASIFENDPNRVATLKDLQDMRYLELIIKETLRLFPSVPIYGRSLNEDLIYGDMLYPKDLDIVIFAYGIHRDPAIYPDPDKFYPERFLPENCQKRSPYAYIPFSAGPRNCIGQKFALLEMKATVSKILRKYELFPSSENHHPSLIAETVLKSSNGIRIAIKDRNL